jgi:uncharacterized protein
MKIDVSDLLKSVGAELRIDKSEKLDLKDEILTLSSPVNVKLKLINTGRTVLVTGTLNTNVKMMCCRCLKEFDQTVSVNIDEEYAKIQAIREIAEEEAENVDEGIEIKDEDIVFEISEDNIIDLSEAIRQNLILALPIKPLCDKACKGIKLEAPKKIKVVDPRLEKLKQFKKAGGM